MVKPTDHMIGYFFIAFLGAAVVVSLWTRPWHIRNEKSFDQSLVHYDLSTTIWKNLKYSIFREGLDGVVIGQGGILFTSEEFSYEINHHLNLEKNLDYIQSVSAQLSKDNIKLIILPVPSKIRLYEPQSMPQYRGALYARLMDLDIQQDHKIVDVYQVLKDNFQDGLFYKRDTHWTSQTTDIIAQSLSENIALKSPKENFKTERLQIKNFTGDLVSYVPPQHYEDEQYQDYKIYNTKLSLFEDQKFPIALVGTSYSADARWHFEGFLKQYFQRDILNVAKKGAGPFTAMYDYLENEYQSLEKPELIIWEIPERYLPVSYDLQSESL